MERSRLRLVRGGAYGGRRVPVGMLPTERCAAPSRQVHGLEVRLEERDVERLILLQLLHLEGGVQCEPSPFGRGARTS